MAIRRLFRVLPIRLLRFIESESQQARFEIIGVGTSLPVEFMYRPPNQKTRDLRAESKFIEEWNLNPAFFEGFKIKKSVKGTSDSFQLELTNPLGPDDSSPRIEALQMEGHIRFGNSFMALQHAMQVAKALNVDRIICKHPDFKSDAEFYLDGVLVTGKNDDSLSRLRGRFFITELLKPFFEGRDYRNWWDSSYRSSAELLEAYGVHVDQPPLGDDEIVIHIRAGDIFEVKFPDPKYAQPPLCYYQEIINSKDWRKVWLVYENKSNPVIPALEEWLEKKGIPFEVSSTDVSTDINLCMKAQHLVFSQGNFLYPVACASKNLRSIYRFRYYPAYMKRPGWFVNSDPEMHLYIDRKGDYVNAVVGKWRNTKKQRKLMVKYPARNLNHEFIKPIKANDG